MTVLIPIAAKKAPAKNNTPDEPKQFRRYCDSEIRAVYCGSSSRPPVPGISPPYRHLPEPSWVIPETSMTTDAAKSATASTNQPTAFMLYNKHHQPQECNA